MDEVSTRCCTFHLDPAGFVQATIREGAVFDVSDARDSVAATWRVAQHRRRPVLVDMRGVRAQSAEARDYFRSDEAAVRLRAVALVAASPMSKVIGNFFLRFGRHPLPTQIFTDEDAARMWLHQFLV